MDYTIYEEKLKSYSDIQLVRYVNQNAQALSNNAFLLLKKEIKGRRFIQNELTITIKGIQEIRNREFIHNIYLNVYNSKKIRSTDDLIGYLKDHEIEQNKIDQLLVDLPELISKNVIHSNNESSNRVLKFVVSIGMIFFSFSISDIAGYVFSLVGVIYMIAEGFGGKNNPKMENLKTSIESYILEHKLNNNAIEHKNSVNYFIPIPLNELTEMFKKAIISREPDEIDDVINTIMSLDNDELATPYLCSLLEEKWHFSHESIVSILQDIGDPRAIKILKYTANCKFDYLSDDNSNSLARKCTWALADIGTREAKEALIDLTKNSDDITAEYAEKRIKNWDKEAERKVHQYI